MTHVLVNVHTNEPSSVVAEAQRKCRHCNSSMPDHLSDEFCCHGCRSAFALIESFELDRFYEIVQENSDALRPAQVQRLDYRLFDNPDFQKEFVESADLEQQTAHFFLDNMTCYACVWVCEQVTKQIDPNARLSINLASGEATLDFSQGKIALSEFLHKFEALGYAVSPNRDFHRDGRSDIARIGVALFCLTNIMMLAFPEYLGASSLEDRFRSLFRWISTVLAAFSIFYAGWPFLKGAAYSLRKREVHLDLPIGLALVVCFFFSLGHTIIGHPHVYYDSTAAVVALLLIGRWVQGGALRRIARQQSQFLEGDYRFARKIHEDGHEQLQALPSIEAGARLKILPGELVPLQCRLMSGVADVNYSLLTGESASQALQQGDLIQAGALNGSVPIEVLSAEPGFQSFLLHLHKASQDLYRRKGHYLGLSEKMAKAFVYFVLVMAFSVLIWNLQFSAEQAVTRFATVLLIACPCIFGFGAPLVIARAMGLGIQRGVLFRSQKALERLVLVRNFFFDKTGTLTEDNSLLRQARWNDLQLQSLHLKADQLLALFRILPSLSGHHVLAALARYAGAGDCDRSDVRAVHEVFGQGFSLVWKGFDLRIGRANFCLNEAIVDAHALEFSYVTLHGKEILRFQLEDRLRTDARVAVSTLQKEGKQLYILTGDSSERAEKLAISLGLGQDQFAATLSPQQKLDFIATGLGTAMVGNGINDSLALARVEIGIAVANATESLKEQSDICLLRPGLDPLIRAIELSASTRKAMVRCFTFALLFNLIGMTLAVTGIATPVLAAILMPISSLSIFAIAQRWQ